MNFSEDDFGSGCGAVMMAYLSGAYVAALVYTAAGVGHWTLICAPLTLPALIAIATIFGGNTEMPADAVLLLLGVSIWGVATFGCWGVLQGWRRRNVRICPFAILLYDVVAGTALIRFMVA